tara:strand:+ start:3678 stop:5198 length:1521 start_codon:yes stop_codon:yes gene_type:complete
MSVFHKKKKLGGEEGGDVVRRYIPQLPSRPNLRPRVTKVKYNDEESDSDLKDELQDINERLEEEDSDWDSVTEKPRHFRKLSLESDLLAALRKRKRIVDAANTNNKKDTLVGREEESYRIRVFLTNAIENKVGCRSMLVSGVPGSGKTETIRKVIHDLRGALGHVFLDAEINCASLASPKQLYSVAVHNMLDTLYDNGKYSLADIFKCRLQKRVSQETAFEIISNISEKTKKANVLIVDEIDCISSQEVLYNLFDMTVKLRSRIVVIGISNMLNFQEKFKAKVTSRISMESVHFKAYTAVQLKSIIMSKLGSYHQEFDKMAIEFASKKVANISGDVRSLFQLCNLSRDIAVKNGVTPTGLNEVLEAKRQMFQSVQSKLIFSCSKSQQVLLIAIVIESNLTGREFHPSMQVRTRHSSLSNELKIPIFSSSKTFWNDIVTSTESMGLIKIMDGGRRNEQVALNVSSNEAIDALKQQYTISKRNELITGTPCTKHWADYFLCITRILTY